MSVQSQLLTLLLNSKKGDELPVITSLQNTGKVIVYDPSTELVSAILKEDLTISSGQGTSFKTLIDIGYNGQSSFKVEGTPDNVDIIINRVPQLEGIDYNYNNQSHTLTITNASIVNSIKTTTKIVLRGFSNSLSKKEELVISSVGQSTYSILEKPKTIDLSLNRANLIEAIDYTYNSETGVIEITNQSYIDQINLNTKLIARKYY
jgi:hypothetical protein